MIPTVMISWQCARAMLDAAAEAAARVGVGVSIAVCDAGGTMKAFGRLDGAPLLSVQAAIDKAYTCVGMGMSTQEWWDLLKEDRATQIAATSGFARLMTMPGGLPLISGGHVVGGVGVSGGAFAQDVEIARSAAAVFAAESAAPGSGEGEGKGEGKGEGRG